MRIVRSYAYHPIIHGLEPCPRRLKCGAITICQSFQDQGSVSGLIALDLTAKQSWGIARRTALLLYGHELEGHNYSASKPRQSVAHLPSWIVPRV